MDVELTGGRINIDPQHERFMSCRFFGVTFNIEGKVESPIFISCTFDDEIGNVRDLDRSLFDECLIGRTAVNFRIG